MKNKRLEVWSLGYLLENHIGIFISVQDSNFSINIKNKVLTLMGMGNGSPNPMNR